MRTRLSTEQRRAQLLAIGTELFAQRPYEQVAIEEVAEIAQISSGLLYHYFPNKWAFFVAITEEEGAKLLAASTPDPALTPLEQIRAGLQVYIDYARDNPDTFRMAQHTAVANRDRSRILQTRVSAQRERTLTILAEVATVDNRTRIAVTGWLAFTQAAILDWLDDPVIGRDELCDLCTETLWAAIRLNAEQSRQGG